MLGALLLGDPGDRGAVDALLDLGLVRHRLVSSDGSPDHRARKQAAAPGRAARDPHRQGAECHVILPGWWQKSLNFGKLTIDTSGLGTVVFNNVGDLMGCGRWLCPSRSGSSKGANPRAQYRKEVVRNILYGTPAPAAPINRSPAQPRRRV